MRNLIAIVLCVLAIGCTKHLERKEIQRPKNTYYISNKGSIENSGTDANSPWNLEALNKHVFKSGDVITVVDTLYGTVRLRRTGDSLITIQKGVIISGDSSGIALTNVSNIRIEKVTLIGSGKGYTIKRQNAGIMMYTDRDRRMGNIWIDSVKASGYCDAGITSYMDYPEIYDEDSITRYKGGFDNIYIDNCVLYNNGYSGINIDGCWPGIQNKNIRIRGCLSYDNRGIKGAELTTYKHSGHGIFVAASSIVLIENCTALNNGWEYGTANIGIWVASTHRGTIRYCTSKYTKSKNSVDGGGFDIDGGSSECIMEYNYSEGNDGEGYLVYEYGAPYNKMRDHIVRYNTSKDDVVKNKYYAAITVGGGPWSGLQIYGNTVTGAVPFKNMGGVTGINMYNNNW